MFQHKCTLDENLNWISKETPNDNVGLLLCVNTMKYEEASSASANQHFEPTILIFSHNNIHCIITPLCLFEMKMVTFV